MIKAKEGCSWNVKKKLHSNWYCRTDFFLNSRLKLLATCDCLNSSKLKGNEYDAYVRNRNLFYVCCSRPRKRLVLFITVPVEGDFMVYLKKLFGVENICTYSEFMSEDK